ncbi:MAG: hypothetical protein FJW34_03440 [Acidobacteria bacterium]|nr:hypothetical protein [Acidobacteriota bacterium]
MSLGHIGKYELLEEYPGGMSTVYRALNPAIGQTVAVKVLRPEACQDTEARARFLLEARTAGNIYHDNTIRVFDYGEDEQGRPYMVMEFLPGEDLGTMIDQRRTGSLADKLRLGIQLARALDHIHALSPQIIHRDIKPANIRVTPQGTVKLMDFGIAKRQDLTLTRPGMTAGSPYYMAPEQWLGRGVTHLVDVYSFGAVLFELLTGAKLVGNPQSVEEVYGRVLHGQPDLTPLRQAGVPEPLTALTTRCVAKDPAQRPQSFTEVRQELERVLQQEERAAPEPTRWPRWLIPSAALVLLAVALAVYLAVRPKPEPPPPVVLELAAGKMLLVEAGPFLAGKDRHTENLPRFYIDQTEVTNEAYARFCRERGRPLPEEFPADRPNYPVVSITFVDAQEFARWAGKRLPNALEWERAARGTDGRNYPWGNNADAARANYLGNPALPTPELAPVDAFPEGASPVGARNMAGNAWEFVDQFQTPSEGALNAFKTLLEPPPTATEPWYTIRGGSFEEPLSDRMLWDFAAVPARYRHVRIGFRCARDVKPGAPL